MSRKCLCVCLIRLPCFPLMKPHLDSVLQLGIYRGLHTCYAFLVMTDTITVVIYKLAYKRGSITRTILIKSPTNGSHYHHHGASTGFHVTAPSLPRSSPSNSFMSPSESSKLNTSRFEAMRSGRADLGSGTKLLHTRVRDERRGFFLRIGHTLLEDSTALKYVPHHGCAIPFIQRAPSYRARAVLTRSATACKTGCSI